MKIQVTEIKLPNRPNELLHGQPRVPVTQVNLWIMRMQGSGMGAGKTLTGYRGRD